jgi:uncharacterized protein DUF2188
MKQNRAIHLVPHKEGWAIRREGATRSTSIHGTLEKARKAAVKIAGKEDVEIVMHRLVISQNPKND